MKSVLEEAQWNKAKEMTLKYRDESFIRFCFVIYVFQFRVLWLFCFFFFFFLTLGPFIRGKIRRVLHKTRLELYHLYEHVLSNKTRLILDEMCRLYGEFASYLRRVLCKTRLIFPRINGHIMFLFCVFVLCAFLYSVLAFSGVFLFPTRVFLFWGLGFRFGLR